MEIHVCLHQPLTPALGFLATAATRLDGNLAHAKTDVFQFTQIAPTDLARAGSGGAPFQ